MTDRITTSDLKAMLIAAARCVREQCEHLSQLDSVAGDGDHGTTMLRVAEQLQVVAGDASLQIPGALLKKCSWNVLSVDGGASSALIGIFFKGLGDASGDDDLDCETLAHAFESGMNALLRQTRATVGDKTMVDALAPAVAALCAAAEAGKPVSAALQEAAAASRHGADSTKALVAHYGRARLLGDKTLGHADAGATSVALIFQGFSEALVAKREMNYGGH